MEVLGQLTLLPEEGEVEMELLPVVEVVEVEQLEMVLLAREPEEMVETV